tara:strand:+ start:256 stop:1014 length:759 start_codon:yes stop_codon:yes gene_type:complete
MSDNSSQNSYSFILKSVTPSDIGGIIGKKAVGLRKIISESWAMYDMYQKTYKAVEEPKPKLSFKIEKSKDDENSVTAIIFTESAIMKKFSKKKLEDHIQSFISKKSLIPHTFCVDFPHHLLGSLIGKGASNIKKIVNHSIYDENKSLLINENDISTAESARLIVKEKTFKDIQAILKNKNSSYLGWPPDENDDDEYISITVTFRANSNPFKDYSDYIQSIQESINNSIQNIKSKYESDLQEINHCIDDMSFE